MPSAASLSCTRVKTSRSSEPLCSSNASERALRDGAAQTELDLLVEKVHGIPDVAHRQLHIVEPVARVQMHTQALLVLGEQLLLADLERLHAQVDELDA